MDDISTIGDDISNFLDMPNFLCDEEILRDLDSLEFANDFNDDFNYEYDAEKHVFNQELFTPIDKTVSHSFETNPNRYGNVKVEEFNLIKHETQEMAVNKNAEQKLMIIRELLDANLCEPTTDILSSHSNGKIRPTYTKQPLNSHHLSATAATTDQYRPNNQKMVASKHPVILPATNVTSANLLKSPTLAATLIGMNPTKVPNIGSISNNNNSNSSNNSGSENPVSGTAPGTGRVVRRNSHNAIEKRYRLSINDKIDELRRMLFLGDDSKMNKSNVLKKAIERIKILEDENNALKCENYNLRISRNLPVNNPRNSIESLNHTGSSPSSNNSESERSIENSPSSSSSMHSSSITSSCLFLKSNENKNAKSNSNRGVKRPLIYNSNNVMNDNSINPNKNEKLARLLLDSKDNYIETESYLGKDPMNQSSKIHSSNVPGFLLCTLALFVVSFQPFDFVFKNYQIKSPLVTSGRHLLQTEDLNYNNGYLFVVLLTLMHWSVAFVLIWGSNNNRFFLKKLFSLFLYKLRFFFFSLIYKQTSHPFKTLIDLKSSLESTEKDRKTFKIKLERLLKDYGCSYKINPIQRLLQFIIYFNKIVFSFIPYISSKSKILKETDKIRMYLMTVLLDQSVIDKSYSRIELIWYKCLLYSISWNAEVNSETLFSRFIFALSISTGVIRRYFLNKVFELANSQNTSVLGKTKLILLNQQAQKLLMRTNPKILMKKISISDCLNKQVNLEQESLVNCYFMAYSQETIEMSSQSILAGRFNNVIVEQLKEIANTCPIILNEAESVYFSTWCCLLIVLLKNQDNQCFDKSTTDQINRYTSCLKNIILKGNDDSMSSSITVLKLLLSTIRLRGNEEDNIFHDSNLKCLNDITDSSKMNITFQVLLKLSLDRIIQALGSCKLSSVKCVNSTIYYANAYSNRLSKQHKQTPKIENDAISKLNTLLQKICHINPLKLISLSVNEKDDSNSISNSNFKKLEDLSYKITDFLSFERDFKLRSH